MAEGAEEAIIGERGHGQSARSNDLRGGRVTVIRLLFQMHVEGMAFPLLPAGTIERISDSMMGRPTAIGGVPGLLSGLLPSSHLVPGEDGEPPSIHPRHPKPQIP